MKGFFDFSIDDTKKKGKAVRVPSDQDGPVKVRTPRQVKQQLPPCEECGLYKSCRTPKMGVTGTGGTGVLILAEAAGSTEDRVGYQLCGQAGQLFREEVITSLGYDLDTDFYKLNVVRCRPINEKGGNRTPTDREIALCHSGTWDIIREIKPIAIILTGRVSLQSYLLDIDIGGEQPSISRWADWAIPDRNLGCWVIPQYHPSFFQYGNNKYLIPVYRRHFEAAIKNAFRTFPSLTDETKKVEIFLNPTDVIPILQKLIQEKPPLLTIDWETTGLKPFKTGHKIVAVGLSWHPEHGISFPLTPEVLPYLLPILKSHRIGKTAHNFKFEELWARQILGVQINNWKWCSQLAAHVLDDRQGIKGLEFQAFVRYGVVGFKDETSPYMKAETANDLNRIEDCPIDKLLLRNALDAMLAHRLALDQMNEIKAERKLIEGYKLFHEGSLAFVDSEITGIYSPIAYYQEVQKQIKAEKDEAERQVMASHYANLWLRKTGNELNPTSPDQLKKLLFNHLGIAPLKKSAKGNPTLDKEDIVELVKIVKQDSLKAFLNNVITLRLSAKTESTYIRGMMREICDDYLHPFFHLDNVRSYRGSSSNPNFQNIPARDERVMHLVRSGILPHPDHQLLEVDFGMHEVRVAACFTKDPELIRYCSDPASDMHRDQTERVFLLHPSQITKPIRNLIKGGFVFAEFYGSWHRPCAEKLWKDSDELRLNDGQLLHDYLRSKGLVNLDVFTEHVKAEERRFWKQFSVYARWKEKWVNKYYETGRVELKHGFRRQGFLERNKILNTAIQGSAFHLLLWSYIELMNLSKKEEWKSKIIGQIHDCILFSVEPSELKHVAQITHHVTTEAIKKPHPWLNVPLDIELELGGVNEPWSTKKKITLNEIIS